VNTSREPRIPDPSIEFLAHSAQTSSREKMPTRAVAGVKSPVSQSSFPVMVGLPIAARGRWVC
jgi:hypothetical protein